MPRLLALDIGRKRTGIAVTDNLKISANGLPTLRTCDITAFLKDFCSKEAVEAFIIGDPKDLRGNPSESMRYITPVVNRIKHDFPDIPVIMVDERFTSSIAHQSMITAGLKKKTRQEKSLADKTAAVIILTSYLNSVNPISPIL